MGSEMCIRDRYWIVGIIFVVYNVSRRVYLVSLGDCPSESVFHPLWAIPVQPLPRASEKILVHPSSPPLRHIGQILLSLASRGQNGCLVETLSNIAHHYIGLPVGEVVDTLWCLLYWSYVSTMIVFSPNLRKEGVFATCDGSYTRWLENYLYLVLTGSTTPTIAQTALIIYSFLVI